MAANLTLNLNQFACNLYNKLTKGKNENFFVSPFSISTALSMVHSGAKTDTAKQLKQLLNLTELSDQQINSCYTELLVAINKLGDQVTLSTANKIYPQNGFQVKKEFTDLIVSTFHSQIEQLNYANAAESAKTINTWVSSQTNNKIRDLIPASALNSLTKMVLVNAIYFKGNWLHKFDQAKTYKEDFHLQNGTSVKVDMMKLTENKFAIKVNPNDLELKSCTFPYAGERVSMTIILPNSGVSVEAIENKLNASLLDIILGGFSNKQKVHVFIPKFKLSYDCELSSVIKSMGATLPFDESNADFSGITDSPSGLHISKVIHKAVVEVNEEGSEAAAATGVIMMTYCMAPILDPEEFKCNRPFIFIIHDNEHKNILFMGKYFNP